MAYKHENNIILFLSSTPPFSPTKSTSIFQFLFFLLDWWPMINQNNICTNLFEITFSTRTSVVTMNDLCNSCNFSGS